MGYNGFRVWGAGLGLGLGLRFTWTSRTPCFATRIQTIVAKTVVSVGSR